MIVGCAVVGVTGAGPTVGAFVVVPAGVGAFVVGADVGPEVVAVAATYGFCPTYYKLLDSNSYAYISSWVLDD
jgi:hypothetical protein